jgi:hypothetical protein
MVCFERPYFCLSLFGGLPNESPLGLLLSKISTNQNNQIDLGVFICY